MTVMVSSGLVASLEECWAGIGTRHPELPEVVMVVASGSGERARRLSLGHFAPDRWEVQGDNRHEILIGGEGLRRGPVDVLGTLLHEAAHAVAEARKVRDTSRGGRYHNRRFKVIAEELGLSISLDRTIGWSLTQVPLTTQVAYADELNRLRDALVLWRREEAHGGRGGAGPSRNLISCECSCSRKIRIAPTTLAAGPINCGVCGGEFEPGGSDFDS
jgi:hypothetical protein